MAINEMLKRLATMHLATYGEGAEEGSIDPNTTLKPLILTRHANVPKANKFYYIHTMFYSEIATTSNRTQVAIGYKTHDIYQRYCNNGVWSDWKSPEDEGKWVELKFEGKFKDYDATATPRIRKIGKIVEIRGTAGVTEAQPVGFSGTLFTIPKEYAPTTMLTFVCQGSSKYRWTFGVRPTGVCSFDRYGISENIAVPASVWLPFNIMYTLD